MKLNLCFKIILLILSFIIINKSFASNKFYKIASYNWSPFSLEKLPKQGIISAFIKEVFINENIDIIIDFFPQARAIIQANNENYIGYFPAHICDNNIFIKSNSIGKSILGFAFLKNSKYKFDSLNDIKNKKVGVVRGKHFNNSFNGYIKKNKLKLEEANSDELNLKKLLYNRIELIIIERNSFDYLTTVNEEFIDKFTFNNTHIVKNDIYVCFNKKHKDILNIFNKNLEKTNKENFYFNYIMENY